MTVPASEALPSEELPEDLQVARLIFGAMSKSDPLTFERLNEIGRSIRSQDRFWVSRSLDKLFDQGLVRTKWIVRDGRNVKVLVIAGEAEALVRAIFNNTVAHAAPIA